MITSLRAAKAELSSLVALAASGEEVVITVRGKPRARLSPVSSSEENLDKAKWLRELKALRRKYAGTKRVRDSQDIFDDLREERL